VNKQERLLALANRIDHEELWRRAGADRHLLTLEQIDRLDAGVMLRRYADILEPGHWLVIPPTGSGQFGAGTLDKAVEMARPRTPSAQADDVVFDVIVIAGQSYSERLADHAYVRGESVDSAAPSNSTDASANTPEPCANPAACAAQGCINPCSRCEEAADGIGSDSKFFGLLGNYAVAYKEPPESERFMKARAALIAHIESLIAARVTQAAPAVRAQLEEQIIGHRIAITPEYEGGFHASIYGEEAEPHSKGYGKTPSEAIAAALRTTSTDGEKGGAA
jgi:hypothetical protein